MDLKLQVKDYKINKKNYFLRIKGSIIGSKLIHLTGFHSDYVEYYLKIETNYADWTLKKRFDEFYKLNSILTKIVPEIKKLFPPTRIFKSTDDIIGERIKLFNKYFNFLFNNINIFLIDEIINFISLSKEIILLFIKKYRMLKTDENDILLLSLKNAYNRLYETQKKNNDKEMLEELENDNNYYNSILNYEIKRQIGFDWNEPPSQTPYLMVVKEFLYNLSEKSENKTEILETFQYFIKNNKKIKKLTEKEIKYLYIGDEAIDEDPKELLNKTDYSNEKRKKISNDFKYHSSFEFFDPGDDEILNIIDEKENKINGLFYIIGNSNKNTLLTVGALELLNKLMDTEYNPDADLYINTFKKCKIKHYKMLNLNDMIKLNKAGNRITENSMKLLKLIFYDKNREEYKDILIEDKEVYKQYINYIRKFIE